MGLFDRPSVAKDSADRAGAERQLAERLLTERLLAGDRQAFDEFFEGHFPGLYRFAVARVRDPDLARDLVQASICQAIAHLRTYRGEASLAGWLYTICRNEIRSHYRKAGRRPRSVDLLEHEPQVEQSAQERSAAVERPDEAFDEKEMAHLVHATLDGLPEKYGRALEWKYLEGLPVQEIAERLEVGPKAAESLLTRARQAFRGTFARLTEGFEPRDPEILARSSR